MLNIFKLKNNNQGTLKCCDVDEWDSSRLNLKMPQKTGLVATLALGCRSAKHSQRAFTCASVRATKVKTFPSLASI